MDKGNTLTLGWGSVGRFQTNSVQMGNSLTMLTFARYKRSVRIIVRPVKATNAQPASKATH